MAVGNGCTGAVTSRVGLITTTAFSSLFPMAVSMTSGVRVNSPPIEGIGEPWN